MSGPGEAGAAAGDSWLTQRERGTVFAIRAAAFWATRFGRRLSTPLVFTIAAWYFLFDSKARAASRGWLLRFHRRAPRRSEIFRHILTFVRVTVDRLYFVTGRMGSFRISRTGNHYLASQARTGSGAVLIGAHLGSFEVLRAAGHSERFPLWIVGHWENARMINALLSSFDPEMPAQVVNTGGDPVNLALTLRDKIRQGGMLALMADRAGLNDKSITVDFFGEKAAFPTGPFLIASILKCPVYLVFGLYFRPNRYELYCEPFAERIELPRGRREAGLEEVVQAYARRLESYCRKAPDNWFNFFEFWETPAS